MLELELELGAEEIGLSLERRRRGGEVRSMAASALISEVPSAALVLPVPFWVGSCP